MTGAFKILGIFLVGIFFGHLGWAEGTEDRSDLKDPKAVTPESSETKEAPARHHLTLESCLRIALTNATNVLKAQNDVDLTGTQVLTSYGQFLPNLTTSDSLSYLSGRNYFTAATPTLVNGKSYGVGLQISTVLNLFNGLADISGLKSALEREKASRLTFERARQQIFIDVTQAYLQVVLDKRLVEIAKNNLDVSMERSRLLSEQTRVGVRNLSDLYRQDAQTSSDESLLITSKNKLRSDEIMLLRRLRLEISEEYDYEDTALDVTPKTDEYNDEAALISTAIGTRADLKAAQSTAEATDWSRRGAKSGYLPKFDLGLSVISASRVVENPWTVGGTNVTPANQPSIFNQLGGQTYFTVGVTLTWNIFDRFNTTYQVQRASVDASNAEIDLKDRRLQVQGEIRQAYVDYHASVQQLVATAKGLRAAEKAFEVVKGRYTVGAASFLDLSTAQSVQVQAQATRVQAEIDFVLRRKLIDFYLGTLNPNS